MRKINLFLAVVLAGILVVGSFVSCKKDGVFKPKEKISKIYFAEIYEKPDAKHIDTLVEKELIEVWKWNKNKLIQVESANGGGWSMYFIYKGNQVTKIESGGDVFNFSYDKNNLTKIEALDEKGRNILTITVNERSGDNITKLTYDYSYYYETKSKSMLFDKIQSVMRITLNRNVGEIVHKNMVNNIKMHKTTNIEKMIHVVELTYSGNNVSKVKTTSTYQNDEPISTMSEYTYDNKKNPYYHALCLISDGVASITSYSENNILSSSSQILSTDTTINKIKTASYIYEYNSNDFPTKQEIRVEGMAGGQYETPYKVINRDIYYYEYAE